MKINDMVKEVHEMAVKKGWHDKERSPLEVHMLIVSEIAEATEVVRNGHNSDCTLYRDTETNNVSLTPIPGAKPEGEAVELADAVIRIADYFGFKGWDLEQVLKAKIEYNATRPYRHGNKAF